MENSFIYKPLVEATHDRTLQTNSINGEISVTRLFQQFNLVAIFGSVARFISLFKFHPGSPLASWMPWKWGMSSCLRDSENGVLLSRTGANNFSDFDVAAWVWYIVFSEGQIQVHGKSLSMEMRNWDVSRRFMFYHRWENAMGFGKTRFELQQPPPYR